MSQKKKKKKKKKKKREKKREKKRREECAATSLRAQIFPGELFFACFSTLVYYSHFGLFPVSTTAESNCNQFAVRGEGVVQCESCIHGQINTCFGVYACMASQKRISSDLKKKKKKKIKKKITQTSLGSANSQFATHQ